MKTLVFSLVLTAVCTVCAAQDGQKSVRLEKPDIERPGTVMKALSERKSTREFSQKELSLRDLSDLLWAANGVNRPDGRRTAPSALNKQDISVYVCMAGSSYLYDHKSHSLVPVSAGDARPVKEAPVCLVLVADEDTPWAGMDAGIVSQNISVFCSSANLATVPRGSMDKKALAQALKLDGKQVPLLNHPVGYFK